MSAAATMRVVDSHTGGEPTRVIVAGGPDLGGGPLAARRERFRRHFDRFRTAIACEPRASDVVVGALLVPPEDPRCTAGVVFFNNVGYLGMCGHGTIGVVATLAYLERVGPGVHRLETPVGVVTTELHADGRVSVTNVASWREAKGVQVDVPGIGTVTGDVAYGGNWFFLVEDHGQSLALHNAEALARYCWRIREAVNVQGYPQVDHLELFGAANAAGADARSFVLCPGRAWDRSPCGTGTSAKLACLASDGRLAEGERWVQESVLASRFVASYRWLDRATGRIEPTITGEAFVNADCTIVVDPRDPFGWGIGRDH
jgi:4-hydroxyproline epimerase